METPYQKRYLAHQERKRLQITESAGQTYTEWKDISEQVVEALDRRKSQRVFNTNIISPAHLDIILDAARKAPTSCNRHGVKLNVIGDKRLKELLGGLLVGGVGWVHRADKIILMFADKAAYVSPAEKDFMPYCDVGFTAMSMWLAAESLQIGACYVNPNVYHKGIFNNEFLPGNHIFLGALALGYFDKRSLPNNRPEIEEIIL